MSPTLRPLGVLAPALVVLGALSGCGAPPADGVAQSSAAISPSPNDQAAYDFFVGKGLTNFQAAGIVGNLDQESQVDPGAVQAGGPGRGIAQWSVGGRWDTDANDNAVWFAGTQGESVSSLTLQLEFVWYELQTFSGYGLEALRATTNVADATIAFETDFEGCGSCDQATRISDAEAALAVYGSSDGGADAHADGDGGTVIPTGNDAGGPGTATDGPVGSPTPAPADDGGASASGASSNGAPASANACALAAGRAGERGAAWAFALVPIGLAARRRSRRVR